MMMSAFMTYILLCGFDRVAVPPSWQGGRWLPGITSIQQVADHSGQEPLAIHGVEPEATTR